MTPKVLKTFSGLSFYPDILFEMPLPILVPEPAAAIITAILLSPYILYFPFLGFANIILPAAVCKTLVTITSMV